MGKIYLFLGAPTSGSDIICSELMFYKGITPINRKLLQEWFQKQNEQEQKRIQKNKSVDLVIEFLNSEKGVFSLHNTLENSTDFEKIKPYVEFVVILKIGGKELKERGDKKRIHQGSQRVYYLGYNNPLREGKDDVTGEILEKVDVFMEDLTRVSHISDMLQMISGLKVFEVDARQSISEIYLDIENHIKYHVQGKITMFQCFQKLVSETVSCVLLVNYEKSWAKKIWRPLDTFIRISVIPLISTIFMYKKEE